MRAEIGSNILMRAKIGSNMKCGYTFDVNLRTANQYDLVVFSTIFRSKYDSTIFLNKIRFHQQQKNIFF